MSEPHYDRIKGSEKLISIFGRWPSFHDSEVLQLTFDRSSDDMSSDSAPSLVAALYVFRMTSKVDERGYYVLRDHTLAHLRFSGLAEVEMGGFNMQNALYGLVIQDIRDYQLENLHYEVHFDGTFGVDLNFKCAQIEVLSAVPYREDPGEVGRTQSLPRPDPAE